MSERRNRPGINGAFCCSLKSTFYYSESRILEIDPESLAEPHNYMGQIICNGNWKNVQVLSFNELSHLNVYHTPYSLMYAPKTILYPLL